MLPPAPDRTPSRRRTLRRAVLATRTLAATTAVGIVAALAVASPATAATTPTISAPAQRTGFGPVTITGTARPGAEVLLIESAIAWNDMQPAEDFDNGGTLTVTANSAGAYRIVRNVDSGFMFAVEADGLRSPTRRVLVKALPVFWMTSPRSGTVVANVDVSPNQPELPVTIQRQTSTGGWTTIASGVTDSIGGYTRTLTTERAGTTQTYRASIGADTSTGLLANVSPTRRVTVAGGPTSTPVGAVKFTGMQYDSPGTDTGSNTSLNKEWFRLTNKSARDISLRGWTVRDAGGSVYRFPTTAVLGVGRNLYIRTGKGTANKPVDNRYWNSTKYIWNNGGDTATVRDAAGKTIDTCKWTSDRDYTAC